MVELDFSLLAFVWIWVITNSPIYLSLGGRIHDKFKSICGSNISVFPWCFALLLFFFAYISIEFLKLTKDYLIIFFPWFICNYLMFLCQDIVGEKTRVEEFSDQITVIRSYEENYLRPCVSYFLYFLRNFKHLHTQKTASSIWCKYRRFDFKAILFYYNWSYCHRFLLSPKPFRCIFV